MPIFEPKLYIKDESFDPIYTGLDKTFYFKSRVMPGVLLSLGFLVLITQVVLPLVSFKTQSTVLMPMEKSVLGITSGFRDFEFDELGETDIGSYSTSAKDAPVSFKLSIPKLGIEDAVVSANSSDLNPDNALGHYKGTALPGEVGTTFIYGHSVLPWFYNPKNYKTIFSTLNNLETGDEIDISYGHKQLRYKVESKDILYPKDVNPLEENKPRYLNKSTLTLMTCWPAGTKTKRLLVKAVLLD